MKRTSLLSVVAASLAVLAAGCPGETKKPAPATPKVTTRPVKKPVKKKKPPAPVCVTQSEQAVIGMASGEDNLVSFCVADGNGGSQCYQVELDHKKYEKIAKPPLPQPTTLATPSARLQSTPTEVRVCVGDGDNCKALKPKLKPGDNPIEAAINGKGTVVSMLLGDAEAGKGVAEVWSVGKKSKKVGSIKYAKGDYRCGTTYVIDDLVFVSAGVCAGPAARGGLYSIKGKKVADVGGKEFGTYSTVPIEIGDHRWAFLSETGGVIAIHDSKTGKLEKTIDLLALWSGGDDSGGGPASGGNPGESVLLRGGDGKLLVVTGSPHPGNIGVVDVEAGTVDVVTAVACLAAKTPAHEEDDDGDGDGSADDGGGSGDDAPPADEPITDL